MNSTDNTPPASEPQSSAKQIDGFATDLQSHAYRIRALAVGISDAIDLIEVTKETGKFAIGRLVSFGELIEDQAEKITDLAEKIEVQAYGLRRGADA